MTTVGMLRRLGVPKGEWLIQTAAGSSLGRMVISVARYKGVSFQGYQVIFCKTVRASDQALPAPDE